MSSENDRSDAEEILSEFQKTHGIEPQQEQEPQPEQEPETKREQREPHNMIFIGTKPNKSYVTATLTQLASLPIITLVARG